MIIKEKLTLAKYFPPIFKIFIENSNIVQLVSNGYSKPKTDELRIPYKLFNIEKSTQVTEQL